MVAERVELQPRRRAAGAARGALDGAHLQRGERRAAECRRRNRLERRRRDGRAELADLEVGERGAAVEAGGEGDQAALAERILAEVEGAEAAGAGRRQQLRDGERRLLADAAAAELELGERSHRKERAEHDGLRAVGEAHEFGEAAHRELVARPAAKRLAQRAHVARLQALAHHDERRHRPRRRRVVARRRAVDGMARLGHVAAVAAAAPRESSAAAAAAGDFDRRAAERIRAAADALPTGARPPGRAERRWAATGAERRSYDDVSCSGEASGSVVVSPPSSCRSRRGVVLRARLGVERRPASSSAASSAACSAADRSAPDHRRAEGCRRAE